MKLWFRIRSSFADGIILLSLAILTAACSTDAAQVESALAGRPEAMSTVATAATLRVATPFPTRTPTPATTDTPAPAILTTSRSSVTPTALVAATITPAPTSPPPSPTAAKVAAQTTTIAPLKVYETVITLPTYPFRDYLVEQFDPVYGMPVYYFDRPAFEAAAPDPEPVDYEGVVIENSYLRLTFLPELGGRLYSAVVKATGQEIFYHNPVVKPSRYGVLQPVEANWWLAAGGMEWAYPTQEHGYRWGVPWDYTVNRAAAGATIHLTDMAPNRIGASVSVSLPADSAAFTVTPRLVNQGPEAVPVQFWLNAALTLGSASMTPETQFLVPTSQVIVHSRGEMGWTVPDAQQQSSWPRVGGTDLSNYSQWANYLGAFIPYLDAPFMGAYNPVTDLGVVRLIEPGQVPGSKLFAFGTEFQDKSYTDDDSQYFEIWGGANTSFWPEDDLMVPGGGTLAWEESWWPLAKLGGITWATQQVAIYLNEIDNEYTLSLLAPRPVRGTLIIRDEQTTLLTTPFTADPAEPQQWHFAAKNGPSQIEIVGDTGATLLEYQPNRDSLSNE